MPALVYYSRELKSYELDLLFAVALPLLALRVLGRGADAPNRAAGAATFTILLAALAAAPWLSFGAVFPAVATLAWGWLTCWQQRDCCATRRWLAATMVFGLSLAVTVQVALATQAASPRLQLLWRLSLFAPQGGIHLGQVAHALGRYATIPMQYFFIRLWLVATGLAILGLCVWPRPHRPLLAWLFVGPGVAMVGVALAGRYLLGEVRLLLFAAPPLLLAVGAGLVWVGSLGGRAGIGLAMAVAVAVALRWGGIAIAHRLSYRNQPNRYFYYDILHDVDALTAETVALARPGEPVLISVCASRPYLFYGRGRLSAATMCVEPCADFPGVADEFLARIGSGQRAWLLLLDEERDLLAKAIDAAGVAYRERATARGGAVWELTRRQAAPPS